ncbi:MAG TPA: ABC transporter substrate-binding protein [Bacillota bacterium]|nr:ABC transporter substrate-binding protein [Bacillota bacterium]
MRLKVQQIVLAILALSLATTTGCGGKIPGQDEKIVKIGFIGPLSGYVGNAGESNKNAFAFAVEQAGGGTGGYRIETVIMDDCNDPVEASNAAQKMIDQDQVKAIVCSGTYKTAVPVSQTANDNKVVVVASAATNPKITVDNGIRKDFVFRACYIDPFQGTVAAKFATDTLKAKTAAVFYDMDSDYSAGLAHCFKDNFSKAGGRILASVGYSQKDRNFGEVLNSMAEQNPDIIYLPDSCPKAALIAGQAREKGIQAIFLGSDGWDYGDTGYEALEGGYFTNHYSPDDPRPEVKKWVETYSSRYGTVPDARSTLCYDATRLLLNAIETINSDNPVKIKEALQATKNFPAVSGEISLGMDGNPVKPAAIIQIKDKKQVYVTTVTP